MKITAQMLKDGEEKVVKHLHYQYTVYLPNGEKLRTYEGYAANTSAKDFVQEVMKMVSTQEGFRVEFDYPITSLNRSDHRRIKAKTEVLRSYQHHLNNLWKAEDWMRILTLLNNARKEGVHDPDNFDCDLYEQLVKEKLS